MTMTTTISECEARAIAAEEAAEYLLSSWTADPRERAAGERIVILLQSEAATWRSKAVRIRERNMETSGVASRTVSYLLSFRWTGDCAAIWNIAVLPLMGFMVLGVFLKIPALAFGAAVALMLLFLGVGLAAHAPFNTPDGAFESAMQRRAAARERRTLARAGLSPERYLATIPECMLVERMKAAQRLGVTLDGRRVL